MTPPSPPPRVRVGISTCLLGERVRWDGGHKLDASLAGGLAPWIEWVPVCPEVEAGMGVPREPVRLVGPPDAPRMVGVDTGRDWTDAMRAWAARRISELRALGAHGFVLKSGSPSCGVRDVEVRATPDAPTATSGRGLWAAALAAADPSMLVEDELRLRDPAVREEFLRRVREHANSSGR